MASYLHNNVATASVELATDVADDGTFTVAYPSGTSQASFTAGLAGTGYVMVNGDKWNEADPGFAFSYGSTNITVTNKTGATLPAGTNLILNFDRRDGNDVLLLALPINLPSVGNADVVTDFRPGVYGTIEYAAFLVNAPATTSGKAATLNLEIGTTDVTGGVIALTSANATPQGKIIDSTAITGNNTVTPDSKLSVEATNAATPFSEGSGTLLIRIRKDPAYS